MMAITRYRAVPLLAAAFVATNMVLWAIYFFGGRQGYLPGIQALSGVLCVVSLLVILPYGALKELDRLGLSIVFLNVAILAAHLL